MKVFLAGTCNNSTWRSTLIPMLRIDYFDPVVKDWTPACMERERNERESCDYLLYVITPLMLGTYSIAEVVDDSNKRPDKTIFYVSREDVAADDTLVVFNDAQWKSLMQVSQMVEENGATVCDNIYDVAVYLNRSEQ